VSWRIAAVLALAAVLASAGRGIVDAHAGLRISDPLDGATLGDTPSAIRLTFSERPDAALSEIRVVDSAGVAYHIGRPVSAPGDPLVLSIQVRALDTGVYTVSWQIVSAVDGHGTTGAYAFGVRADPSGAAAATAAERPQVPLLGVFARWLLIGGLVALLGAGAAAVGRFGGGSELGIGSVACSTAVAGVLMLILAQARSTSASLAGLMNASAGRSLAWRLAALAVAGAAMTATALHVAGGHAAAANRWVVATIASQWVHFVAVGIWLGGLAALLLGLRGVPSASKADVVRRFSLIATIALVVVAATGVLRSAGELTGWSDLTTTAYGQAVVAKIILTAGIAAFAAVNHWHSVAAAIGDLRPLRRAGGGEMILAGCTLAVAAILGSLPPPAAALRDPSGLLASGVDFGTTVRVRLTTPSDQPGPNRFVVNVADYDSGQPVRPRRVSLRFTPLDDARVAPTIMDLRAGSDDSFVGSGSNLAFDGRWRITALVEGQADAVEVPMEVETRIPPQFVSIERPSGRPRNYMVQVENAGHIAISPDSERAGPTTVTIICYDVLRDQRPVDDIVVTLRVDDGPAQPQPVTRVSPSTFVSPFAFESGSNRITVVARGRDGTRLRAALTLDIP
jgi:copper transport protein